MAFVTRKLTIDKAGRIVLPKPLRDELQLAPGDALQMDSSGGKITLRPVRENAPLRKKRGVWVYSAGEPLADSPPAVFLGAVFLSRQQFVRVFWPMLLRRGKRHYSPFLGLGWLTR